MDKRRDAVTNINTKNKYCSHTLSMIEIERAPKSWTKTSLALISEFQFYQSHSRRTVYGDMRRLPRANERM